MTGVARAPAAGVRDDEAGTALADYDLVIRATAEDLELGAAADTDFADAERRAGQQLPRLESLDRGAGRMRQPRRNLPKCCVLQLHHPRSFAPRGLPNPRGHKMTSNRWETA